MDRDPWIRRLDYGTGSGFGSCSFRQWFQGAIKNIIFLLGLHVTYNRYIASVFKNKKPSESKKQLKSRFFVFFCLLMEGSGSGTPKNLRILRIRNAEEKILSKRFHNYNAVWRIKHAKKCIIKKQQQDNWNKKKTCRKYGFKIFIHLVRLTL